MGDVYSCGANADDQFGRDHPAGEPAHHQPGDFQLPRRQLARPAQVDGAGVRDGVGWLGQQLRYQRVHSRRLTCAPVICEQRLAEGAPGSLQPDAEPIVLVWERAGAKLLSERGCRARDLDRPGSVLRLGEILDTVQHLQPIAKLDRNLDGLRQPGAARARITLGTGSSAV
jgi:hypothetical protein